MIFGHTTLPSTGRHKRQEIFTGRQETDLCFAVDKFLNSFLADRWLSRDGYEEDLDSVLAHW